MSTATPGHLTFEVRQNVAWITFSHPSQYNTIDRATADALLNAASQCCTDPSIRAIVITGAGNKAFCAGADVAAFKSRSHDIESLLLEMTAPLHLAISRLSWGSAPVIAAVNGVAAGGGLGIVAAADLVIAAEGARFTSAYSQIGLTPDSSTSYFLPRLIGLRRATELYLTNRVLSAQEALEWGLVNKVVAAKSLHAIAAEMASTLAKGPARAHIAAKQLFHLGMNDSLETQMEREVRSIIEMSRTADGQEGIAAFSEKRKPSFRGA